MKFIDICEFSAKSNELTELAAFGCLVQNSGLVQNRTSPCTIFYFSFWKTFFSLKKGYIFLFLPQHTVEGVSTQNTLKRSPTEIVSRTESRPSWKAMSYHSFRCAQFYRPTLYLLPFVQYIHIYLLLTEQDPEFPFIFLQIKGVSVLNGTIITRIRHVNFLFEHRFGEEIDGHALI